MNLLKSRIAACAQIMTAVSRSDLFDVIKVTKTPKVTRIRIVPKTKTGIPTVILILKVDNFIVYLKDLKGNETAGIMSIRSPSDVKKFVKWYGLMLDLAAYRRD